MSKIVIWFGCESRNPRNLWNPLGKLGQGCTEPISGENDQLERINEKFRCHLIEPAEQSTLSSVVPNRLTVNH